MSRNHGTSRSADNRPPWSIESRSPTEWIIHHRNSGEIFRLPVRTAGQLNQVRALMEALNPVLNRVYDAGLKNGKKEIRSGLRDLLDIPSRDDIDDIQGDIHSLDARLPD